MVRSYRFRTSDTDRQQNSYAYFRQIKLRPPTQYFTIHVNQSGIESWGLCVRAQPASRMTDRQSMRPDVEPRRHFSLNINLHAVTVVTALYITGLNSYSSTYFRIPRGAKFT